MPAFLHNDIKILGGLAMEWRRLLVILVIAVIVEILIKFKDIRDIKSTNKIIFQDYLLKKYNEPFNALSYGKDSAIFQTSEGFSFMTYKTLDGISDNKSLAVAGDRLGNYFRDILSKYDNIIVNCRVSTIKNNIDLSHLDVDSLKELSDNLNITVVIGILENNDVDKPNFKTLDDIVRDCNSLGFKHISFDVAYIKRLNENNAYKFIMKANLGQDDWQNYTGHIIERKAIYSN